jgi:beta-aspartyl-dipeptidase (metallo-type)
MATLFRRARLYDPAPRGIMDILVVGERVAAVAPDLSDIRLPGLAVADLDGRLVLPGLVDAHVHLSGGGGEGGFASRIDPLRPEALAAAGVTTAVGVLGTDGLTRSLEDLYARAKALDAWGLSGWMYSGNYRLPPKTLTGAVQSDIVLIDKVVGMGEIAVGDHRSSQPGFEELARLAADARVGGMIAGKPAPVHIHLGDDPAGLELLARLVADTQLPAGQFWPTHLNRHQALLKPALALAKAGMPFDLSAGYRDSGDEQSAAAVLARLLEAGVPAGNITISSDANGSLPVFDAAGRLIACEAAPCTLLINELRALLATGFGLETALPLASANPARILGLPGSGRLVPGARADLLVADESLSLLEVWASGVRRA